MNLSLYKLETLEKVVNFEESDNPNGVTVVYAASVEPKETQLFLEKVFSAVSISLEETHRITVRNEQPAALIDWSGWPNCQKLLFFGVKPGQLGIHYEMQAYTPKIVDSRQVLLCDHLDKIQQDPTLKKSLWVALQQIFDING